MSKSSTSGRSDEDTIDTQEPVPRTGLADAFTPSRMARDADGRGSGLGGIVRRTPREPRNDRTAVAGSATPAIVTGESVVESSGISTPPPTRLPAPENIPAPQTAPALPTADEPTSRRTRPQNRPRTHRSDSPRPATPRTAGGAAKPSAGSMVVRLTPAARTVLTHERARTSKPNTELVLLALENQHERLADLVRAHGAPVVQGKLFTIVSTSTRELRVQVSLRLTAEQVRVIDELVTLHGAFDRGELIEAAVHAEYGQDGARA